MAYVLSTTFFTPLCPSKTQFQGTGIRRLTGRMSRIPASSTTEQKHLMQSYFKAGMILLNRSSCCSSYAPPRQYVEPILCHLEISFGANVLISGFWIGPDIEDGWGFVEATLHPIH